MSFSYRRSSSFRRRISPRRRVLFRSLKTTPRKSFAKATSSSRNFKRPPRKIRKSSSLKAPKKGAKKALLVKSALSQQFETAAENMIMRANLHQFFPHLPVGLNDGPAGTPALAIEQRKRHVFSVGSPTNTKQDNMSYCAGMCALLAMLFASNTTLTVSKAHGRFYGATARTKAFFQGITCAMLDKGMDVIRRKPKMYTWTWTDWLQVWLGPFNTYFGRYGDFRHLPDVDVSFYPILLDLQTCSVFNSLTTTKQEVLKAELLKLLSLNNVYDDISKPVYDRAVAQFEYNIQHPPGGQLRFDPNDPVARDAAQVAFINQWAPANVFWAM